MRQWLGGLAALLCMLAIAGCSSPADRADGKGPKSGEAVSAAKPIVIGTDAAFPPMEYTDAGGAIIGFDIDLMRAVGAKLGREAKFENIAWSGIFGALKNGTVDLVVSSVTITEDRQKEFLFSRAYLTAGQVLVVRAADAEKYKTLESLHGHKVGVQVGTTGHDRMEKEKAITTVAYESSPLAFIDLTNGAVDAVMIDKPVADYYSSQAPEAAGKLSIGREVYTDESFGIVARKEDLELIRQIDAALIQIKDSGEFDRIAAKWFGKPVAVATGS